jgi:hypothetical protein
MEVAGESRKRRKATRVIEKAARALESLFGFMIALGGEEERKQLAKIGRIPISQVINELRIYSRMINLAQLLSLDKQAGHLAKPVARHGETRRSGYGTRFEAVLVRESRSALRR